ncbi:MAG TPA: YebC/PmpR family DNA-binding transcriptional regulator [Polyangia bacterium]|jgi:YebC/PmpR family DNA-binding regulatory protein
MSGHNRWSKIKHKKEASDSKKSKVWTKVIKEITVSARLGGGDLHGNPRLRTAVDKARAVNMTNDVVERSIKKGIGDLDGVTYDEFAYEVYGPGGTAMIVEIMTDNRNRTASEVRNVLQRYNGNLGALGSVAYMFKKQGVIMFDKTEVDENIVTDLAIELGADDVKSEAESITVLTEPKEFERIREAFKEKKLAAPVSAEVTMVPQTLVRLTGGDAEKAVKLVSALEDNDDVQNVYSNMDVDDSVLESVG